LISENLKQKLKDIGLPVQQCLAYLLCQYYNVDVSFIKLSKPYIVQLYRLGLLEITKSGILVKGLFDDTQFKQFTQQSVEQIVNENIDSYRSLFKGVKTGSLGNKNDCITKMIRWMYTNPQYSFNQVLEKTKGFIKVKKEAGENVFIPQADYFIYKITNGEEKSTLSVIIDEEFVENNYTKTI